MLSNNITNSSKNPVFENNTHENPPEGNMPTYVQSCGCLAVLLLTSHLARLVVDKLLLLANLVLYYVEQYFPCSDLVIPILILTRVYQL